MSVNMSRLMKNSGCQNIKYFNQLSYVQITWIRTPCVNEAGSKIFGVANLLMDQKKFHYTAQLKFPKL